MKQNILFIILCLALLFLPFLLIKEKSHEKTVLPPTSELEIACPILIEVKGVKEKIPLESYILGVVAAEMPATFHEEALKAQSIASRTYVLRDTNYGQKPIDPTVLKQVYASEEDRKKKWGASFSQYEDKLKKVIAETEGNIIVYKDQLITAMFFSSSNGQTESAENYSGNVIPYLVSVPSESEELYAPNRTKQFEFTHAEWSKAFKMKWNANIPKTYQVTKTDTDRVESIHMNGKSWTGREVRTLLGLPSTDFTITFQSDKVVVDTVGYGHGVGMSQYGAEVLANDSVLAQDILLHYYKGTEIKKFSPCLKSP
ncbi:stage II sporulation protein D [Psychrobacillus sp. OK028]|uniref:stage II sporulation protein D n=1 Tax=Psychrobacillus sp. OK028 TaxID=1884359 RepID=UPI00088C44BA|nr:stage II sporulation protein D [Psychrobacillus sp. OK028]SDN23285.1 stage II sporulation protein D [Psychrobacillus sp. OK028]